MVSEGGLLEDIWTRKKPTKDTTTSRKICRRTTFVYLWIFAKHDLFSIPFSQKANVSPLLESTYFFHSLSLEIFITDPVLQRNQNVAMFFPIAPQTSDF
jgi:hypothetical protein